MSKIYLVRHCESEGNACRRTQAHVEAQVTVRGYEQTEQLRRRFRDVRLDAVYSSDSFRALATAEPVAKDHGLTVRVSISLREITTGAWEDMAWGNIAREYPEEHERWRKTPWDLTTVGASDFKKTGERLIWGLQRIGMEIGKDGIALVVSHSSAIKAAQCLLLGNFITSLNEIRLGENTSVSLLDVDENGTIDIEYLNDISHLPQSLRNTWMGIPAEDLNMAVYPAKLPEQEEWLLPMARLDAEERGQEFDEKRWLSKVRRLTDRHPGFLAISYIHDRPCGFVQMELDENLPGDCAVIEKMFVLPELEGKGYGEQLFGYAAHLLRYSRHFCYVAVPKQGTKEEERIRKRFVFEEMWGNPQYQRLYLFCPSCPYPILA